jgi:Tfp pilus assembly protein PilO
MSFLPKNRQKRNQLFMALGGTAILIAGIAYGVIRPQYAKLSSIRKETADTQAQLKTFEKAIQESDATANQLATVSERLSNSEQDMASGDIYAWTVDTMRHFKANYKVDVPEIGQPGVSDVDIMPQFPYKQLKFSVRGTGYYHDIGKFIADLENKFPHMRVVNLSIEPASNDSEKLAFRMDIIALVKSAS